MRIGIDFDNTIVNYDGVFHAAALERGLIPADFRKGKNDVRDYLNGSGRKDDFTELQGYVYGTRMELAAPYPGFEDFVRAARAAGHELFVVSHKTKLAMLGPKHDLHEAARGFLRAREFVGDAGVPEDSIFFALTKDEKVQRARSLGVDVFIDDLPEILAMLPSVRRILFAPDGAAAGDYEVARSWGEVSNLLLGLR
jgi:hypothetical protein